MFAMHAHGDLAMGAHAIHYGIVGVGVLGLVALLTPQFLAAEDNPPDDHERRVHALRSALAQPDQTSSGLAAVNRSATDLDPTRVATQESWLHRAPALTAAERVLLPLAVVSSVAAAGVHAAVAPEHAAESALFGVFFWASALLQLVWAGAVAMQSSRRLLLVGATGNLAVIGLWAITRTLGLPFGLLPGPEAVGPWDVACAAWELVIVFCCIATLQSRDRLPRRLVGWRHWHPALPTYVAGSLLLLVALSFSGAGA
jgi:hypothetical protein